MAKYSPRRRQTLTRSLPLTLMVMLMSGGLRAQSNFGSIQGTVHDPSGALIPGAKVTVTSLGTSEVRTALTNKQGGYDIEALQPVLYRVDVVANGFSSAAFENVKVDTSKNVSVNVTLKVEGSVQEVAVMGSSPQLQTEDGTSSFTINQRTIQDMPLYGRNTLSLALTLPGATGNAGSEYGGTSSNANIPGRELIINGGRPGTSQFVADGHNVTSPGLARTTVSFSPDTIQEFTVLESNFSAQYAQAGGAIIQQTTRGGTNQFHGDVFEFYRTRNLTAIAFDSYVNPTNGNSKAPLTQHQFGIVGGGPVIIPKLYNGRNKTFFFASFEPTRINAGNITPNFEIVPTTAERQGNFCDSQVYHSNGTTTPYPALYNHFVKDPSGALLYAPNPNFAGGATGATNPRYAYDFSNSIFDPAGTNCANGPGHRLVDASGASYVNPASAKIAAFYEAANIPRITSGNNAGANYQYFFRAKTTDNRYSVRIDQVLPRNNTMFVRVTLEPVFTSRYGRDVVMEPNTSDASRAKQIILSETAIIRTNIVNNLLIGYNGGNFARDFPSNYQSVDATTPLLGTGGTPNPLGYGLANFYNGTRPFGGAALYGILGTGGIQNISRDSEAVYTASDDLTWTFGRHTLHTGVSSMLQQSNDAAQGAGYLAGGKWNFTNGVNNKIQCGSGNITITAPTSSAAKCATDGTTGDGFAAFLEGVSSNLTFLDNGSPTFYYRWFSLGSYVQDDFKVLPNLTLNLGVRHQFQSPRWEKYNRQGQLNLSNLVTSYQGLPAPVFEFAGYDGRTKYLDPVQYLDFEPRFGFSWSPYYKGTNNLVIRGGYGLTHDILTGRSRTPFPALGEANFSGFRAYNPVSGNDGAFNYTNIAGCGFASCQNNMPGQFQYNNVSLLADPNLYSIPSNGQITNAAKSIAPGSGLQYPFDARYSSTGAVFAKDFKTPYVQTFSLQVQTQLTSNTALTLGWQGSKGTKLFSTPFDINNNPVTFAKSIYPGFTGRAGANGPAGQILLEDATHSGSIYHALIANLERRFVNGLQFDVNYTYSKSLDDSSGGIENDPSAIGGQDSSAQKLGGNIPQTSYGSTNERSISTFDTPHVFNITSLYELPVGRGQRFLPNGRLLDAVVGGWQISSLTHITSGQATYLTLGDENHLDDFYNAGSSNYNPRPNIIPGIPLKNPDWSPKVANTVPYLNPRAFTIQGPAQFGNAPRMISGLRLPLAKRVDASVFKSFHPFENNSRRLEVRAEFFNVFNWRSFGNSGVSTNLTNGGINQNLGPVAAPGLPVGTAQQNRYGALTADVWNAYLHGQCAAPANGLSDANGTADSAATVCSNLNVIYNTNFYILGQNSQNTITPRLIQLAAKIYF